MNGTRIDIIPDSGATDGSIESGECPEMGFIHQSFYQSDPRLDDWGLNRSLRRHSRSLLRAMQNRNPAEQM